MVSQTFRNLRKTILEHIRVVLRKKELEETPNIQGNEKNCGKWKKWPFSEGSPLLQAH